MAQPGLYVVVEWTGGFHAGHKRLNDCLSAPDPGIDKLTSRGGICRCVGCCSIYYLQPASWCLDRSLESQACHDPVRHWAWADAGEYSNRHVFQRADHLADLYCGVC